MKYFKMIIAAVLAICLTACSFLNSTIENGTYECQVTLEGGSGRATVESPAEVTVDDTGKSVRLVWSSPNYDYMIVDEIRYENEATSGDNSVFTIPFDEFDKGFTVIADTTAMSTPHEIEYEITVYSPDSDTSEEELTKKLDAYSLDSTPADLGTLEKAGSMELSYATQFSVDYYENEEGNNYTLIQIGEEGSAQYFMLGTTDTKPDGVSDNVVYLNSIDNTYLVSTSVMDLICEIGATDSIGFSGTDSNDWYIKEAKEKVASGEIIYAGKYSAPDYELLVSKDCNFAIENTMIYHNPEVKERLEELGIPVMVERSSYEKNPLGRLEWIKLYGVIYGKLDVANEVFEEQESKALAISDLEETGKTVAIFSIDSNGMISVRKPGDYLASMVDMAGGIYVPSEVDGADENALSTMKITMEDFYLQAADADVLIYNSTIEGELSSVNELIAKADILTDFSAVKNGQVYCLEKGYFQQSADVAEFIEDVHYILSEENQELKHVYKLEE